MEKEKTIAQFRAEWAAIRRRHLARFTQEKQTCGANPALMPVILGIGARRQITGETAIALAK